MLKPILSALAVALALAVVLTPANAYAAASRHNRSGGHWYVDVGVGNGQGHAYYSSSGVAARLGAGWRYANTRGDAFGIGLTDTGVSLDESTTAGIVGLDLNTKLHLASSWFLSGRVGAYTGTAFNFTDNTRGPSKNGTYYGVGTGIDLNPSNALTLSWDRYQVGDYTVYDGYYGTTRSSGNAYLDVYLLTYTHTF